MMTRLWPASLALALIFGAGQAFAQTATPCQYSKVVFDSSTKNITVTCSAANGSPTATLSNKQTSCTYSSITITGSSGAIDATCTGASTSTGASFTVSAANLATTVGTPLLFSVIRTASNGTPVDDTLTLAAIQGDTAPVATASFYPTSVSFGASEPASASRTSRVIFTSAGTAKLTLTPRSSGDTITSSALITVSGASTSVDTCSDIPVPPYATEGGSATASTSTSLGIHRLIAASASERAAGAIRFTAPSSGSLTFNVDAQGLAAAGYPGLSSLDMTVSACPGDFSKVSSACKVPGTISKGAKITVGTSVSTTDCIVKAGSPYYVNVRSVTPGRDVGLHLSTTSP